MEKLNAPDQFGIPFACSAEKAPLQRCPRVRSMASESVIKEQIERMVKGRYSTWVIGLTKDPGERKAQVGQPLNWLHWRAESERAAGIVLQHFVQRGMESNENSAKLAKYIYVFLRQT